MILRLDPVSGRIVHRFDGFPAAIGGAAGDGAMWVSSAGGLSRIDASTNTVTATARLPQPLWAPAVGGGFVWAANEAKGETYKVDQRGTVVATYATGDGARKVNFSAGSAWVTNQDAGTVTRIDAVTGARTSVATHHTVAAAAAGAGRLLVEVGDRRSYVETFDALAGSVARFVVPVDAFHPTDPALAVNPFAVQAEQATLAGLLNYPDAPAPAGNRLQPEIAAAMPALTPDRRTYTFTIRPGFRFSPPSGEASPRRASAAGSSTRWRPRSGTAHRADDCSTMCAERGPTTRAARRGSAGCARTAPRLAITLERPSPDFLQRLSLPYFAPLPAGVPNVAGGAGDLPPPAAGPYYAADAINGEYMLLKRNPYYRGSRPHALDAIVLRQGIDPARAVEQVERGEWDGVALDDPLLAPAGPLSRRAGAYSPTVLPATALRRVQRSPWPVRLSARPPRGRRCARAQLARRRARPRARARAAPTGHRRDATDHPSRGSVLASTVTAVMAVEPGCDACERAYPLVRAALAGVGIAVRRRAGGLAEVRRRPHAFDLLLDRRGARVPGPRDLPRPRADRRDAERVAPATTVVALRQLRPLSGTAREHAAIALAVQLAERDAPVAALGHPAIGQLLSARLGCRVPSRFGVNLAALCLR